MDAVVNGEVSDESADKEKQNFTHVVSTEIDSYPKDNAPKNLSYKNSASLISAREASEVNEKICLNFSQNEFPKDEIDAPESKKMDTVNYLAEHANMDRIENSSTNDVSGKSDILEVENVHEIPLENISKSSTADICNVDKISSSTSLINKVEISDNIPESNVKSSKEIESIVKKNVSEASVSSTNDQPNLSVESPIVFNEMNNIKNSFNISDTLKNLVKISSSASLDDHLENPCTKTSEVSISKNTHSFALPSLAEQVSDNVPHEFPSVSEIALCKSNSLSHINSKTSDVSHSGADSKYINNNESSPLEQLNQHLKSIGNSNEMHNYSLSKVGVSDMLVPDSKTELKQSQKDNAGASVDRLKESDSFVFTEISKEETGFPDIFSGLVTIGKYISVKGDFTLRSSEALIESPSLIAPYLLKEPDSFPPKISDTKSEQKDFFHSAAGELLIGIGLSRVNEWYHRDMTRIKKRLMKREGKSPQLEEDLKIHETFYNEARKANKIYTFPLKSCKTCGFITESSIVMEGHLLIPHLTPRREYQCNFCDTIHKDPKAVLEHMYRVHSKNGRIQPPFSFFECPYCTFENNSKVKLNNHLQKCQRFFDPNRNQAPPKDFEFPALTPKPITVAVVKAYEKSLSSMQRGRGRPKKVDNITEQINLNQFPSVNPPQMVPPVPSYRPSSIALSESLSSMPNQIIPPIQMPNMNLRPSHSNTMGQLRPGLSPMHLPPPNRYFQVVNSSTQLMPMISNNPLVTSPSPFSFAPPNMTNSVPKKVPPPTSQFLNTLFGNGLRQQNPPKNVNEVTITPLPKLQGPYPVPFAKPSTPSGNTSMQSNSLVVCEICDGYIKDLEQLRTHMQLIHKVKIHPKMLVSRPPLNCQKCQWRFFTDQGLERHLLGAHGLVTSNMQELANKSKDAGCCTICGRVYASKLVSHMNQVHKLTLKPAHLSYKCTVCSATFNLYRLFENHVYLVHSGAAKRPADGSSNPPKKLKTPDIDNSESQFEDEPKNHKEQRTLLDDDLIKCIECGNDFIKHAAQTDKCEKCLNHDISQGILSTKMS